MPHPTQYKFPPASHPSYTMWAIGAVFAQTCIAAMRAARYMLPREHPLRVYINGHAKMLSRACVKELPTPHLCFARVFVFTLLTIIVYQVIFGGLSIAWITGLPIHDPLFHEGLKGRLAPSGARLP